MLVGVYQHFNSHIKSIIKIKNINYICIYYFLIGLCRKDSTLTESRAKIMK